MAWLQVHQTLKDHRKLFDAADQLEVEPPHMMGLLVSFWLWALDNAPTGSLVDITPRMISRAAQWDGDPEKLAKTLIRAGWIDEKEDGTLEIHDWYICYEEDAQESVVLRELLDKKLWKIPDRIKDKGQFEEKLNQSIRQYHPEYWRARQSGREAAEAARSTAPAKEAAR